MYVHLCACESVVVVGSGVVTGGVVVGEAVGL